MEHKCKQCGETDLTQFYIRSNGKPRGKCKKCYLEYSQTEKSKKTRKEYNKTSWTKEQHAEYSRKRYEDHGRDYYLTRAATREQLDKKKERYKNDPMLRAKHWMRATIQRCLNGQIKQGRSADILGYTSIEFLERFGLKIELFKKNNIIHNIDHKIPLEWFLEGSPINIMSALDNLQVISEDENKSKIARFAHPVSQEFAILAIQYIKPEYQDQVIIE